MASGNAGLNTVIHSIKLLERLYTLIFIALKKLKKLAHALHDIKAHFGSTTTKVHFGTAYNNESLLRQLFVQNNILF